ncbi:MAG: sulfatase-like hydrolase/transferase [Bacteroidia bacterium]|nr:sulfatase-like hydrolase/transferase [Bacteroidia bacterium]
MKTSPNIILSSLALLSVSITAHSQTKPNYVVILADDLGYGDLSCHGGKTPTPNLDKLFSQGVELSNFMTCPVSSPTRAGLLTGINPLRIGQGPNTDGQLDTAIPTMGSILKKDGYTTGIFGKWHNGNVPEFYPTLSHVNEYGFDKFVGFYGGGCDYYTKVWSNKPTSPNWYNDKTEINTNMEYTTDVITRSAIEFMEQNKANRFLAYVPFNIVHSPLHVKDVELQRVPSAIVQAAGGTLRTWKEYYKLYNDGDTPEFNTMYAQLTGDNSIFDIKGTLTTAERQILYSAMLINLDDKVGELMKYLDDTNLASNTVVLFFSDNGATLDGSGLPFTGNKHSTLEGGVHAPAVLRWPAGGMVGPRKFKPMVGYLDVLPTFMEISGISTSTIIGFGGITM